MPLSVALTHRTTYRYDRLVALGPQTIRLRPAPHARTPVLSYALTIEPEAAFPQLAAGPAGQSPRPRGVPRAGHAFRRRRSISWPTWRRSIRSTSSWSPRPRHWPFTYDPVLEQELAPFRRLAPVGPRCRRCWTRVPRGEQPHRGHAGRAQPRGAEPRRLHRAHGARRLDAGGDAGSRPRAPAAIPPGCWCRCCASSATPRASSPAI